MSMILCDGCGELIDSDDDPECFVEVGNMRRLHQTKVFCECCRDQREAEADEAANHPTDEELEAIGGGGLK